MHKLAFLLLVFALHASLIGVFAGKWRPAEPARLAPPVMQIALVATAADHEAEAELKPPVQQQAGAIAPAQGSAIGQKGRAEWSLPGRLDKMPQPLQTIDLNLDDIGQTGYRGQIKLALYIDRNGRVVDVQQERPTALLQDSSPNEPEQTARLVALVAKRFLQARFAPGEIAGRPVDTRLTITVVAEVPDSSSL